MPKPTADEMMAAHDAEVRADERKKVMEELDDTRKIIAAELDVMLKAAQDVIRLMGMRPANPVVIGKPARRATVASEEEVKKVLDMLSTDAFYGNPVMPKEVAAELKIGLRSAADALRKLAESHKAEKGRLGYRLKAQPQAAMPAYGGDATTDPDFKEEGND